MIGLCFFLILSGEHYFERGDIVRSLSSSDQYESRHEVRSFVTAFTSGPVEVGRACRCQPYRWGGK